jgi:hypothetical protein
MTDQYSTQTLRQPSPQAFDVMVDHWSASMLLAIQAIQHLHAAFDGKLIRSKSNP